ncbi:ABC transporter G family member 10 [Nymphaea thermarum]|nr:ABC transporter G family member 10 [Nymphaea thermarum]
MKSSSTSRGRKKLPVGSSSRQHGDGGDIEAAIVTRDERQKNPKFGDLLQKAEEEANKRLETPAGPSSSERRLVAMEEGIREIPFVLSFTDLSYSIRVRRMSLTGGCKRTLPSACADSVEVVADPETRVLLNQISGEARDGEILAVLGASGSGKSTLIDALANRIARGSLRGTVTLNGEAVEGRLMRSISAYVMQDDLLFPMLSVEETLTFAAEFRLPQTVSKEKKRERVEALIDQLDLRRAVKTVIGDEGHRGVSGGERRRVSIGIDIIHDPILLFLDEPTSGLDSTSAFMVVKVLQRIARTGSIVIMSIHQPSSRIVGLLDRMIFLSRGHTVYNGPPFGLSGFLSDFGHRVPENENHVEFALDLIRELEASSGGIKVLVDFYKSWKSNQPSHSRDSRKRKGKGMTLKAAINASISRGKLVSANTKEGCGRSPEFANPFWRETVILTKRSMLNTHRMPELFVMRLVMVIVTGFILATIFWQLDTTPKGVRERLSFLAFAMSTIYYTCADALPVFLQERYIFMRETAYNAYRRSSYVLSNAIVTAPPLLIHSLAFAAITFFAVGLAGGGEAFLYFFAMTFASYWAGSGMVTFFSGVISHVMLGYTVVVAILAYYVLFSGFFINRDRIPPYWIWFHYLSLVKYSYEGVLHNEFARTSRCFSTGRQMFDNTPLKDLSDDAKAVLLKQLSGSLGGNITLTTCLTTGSDILKQQSVTQLSRWSCFWITIAWGFFFRLLFYVALLIGSKNKRR